MSMMLYVIISLMFITFMIVVVGFISLLMNNKISKKTTTKLMSARVLTQAIVIALVLLFTYMGEDH